MKLLWTAEARQDRRDTREHIAKGNLAAAVTLDEMFTRKARNLVDHPTIGRPGRVPGARELIVHRNYIQVYDLTGKAVRILRVLHARRRWSSRE